MSTKPETETNILEPHSAMRWLAVAAVLIALYCLQTSIDSKTAEMAPVWGTLLWIASSDRTGKCSKQAFFLDLRIIALWYVPIITCCLLNLRGGAVLLGFAAEVSGLVKCVLFSRSKRRKTES